MPKYKVTVEFMGDEPDRDGKGPYWEDIYVQVLEVIDLGAIILAVNKGVIVNQPTLPPFLEGHR